MDAKAYVNPRRACTFKRTTRYVRKGGTRKEGMNMRESEKFRQANREAKATVVATVLVIVFWTAAGFGLSGMDVEILHTPLWVWGGCVGTWIFACLVAWYLAKYVFMDMSLDSEPEGGKGKPAKGKGVRHG